MTRREAREEAFFIVFEHSFSGETVDDIIANAVEGRALEIAPFSYDLAQDTIAHLEELDRLVEKHATRWKKSRISKVALAALRIAICEMLFVPDIPESVSINEAVELAKKFGGEEDSSFVNGVLGAVSRQEALAKEPKKPE